MAPSLCNLATNRTNPDYEISICRVEDARMSMASRSARQTSHPVIALDTAKGEGVYVIVCPIGSLFHYLALT